MNPNSQVIQLGFHLFWIIVLIHIVFTWIKAIHQGLHARRHTIGELGPQPDQLMPVSIIVPARNEQGTVERRIHALQKVTYPCWEALIMSRGKDNTFAAAAAAAERDVRFRVVERGPEPKAKK